jgi:hypothetical protein
MASKSFFSKIFTKETPGESMKGAFKLQVVFIIIIVVCIIGALA